MWVRASATSRRSRMRPSRPAMSSERPWTSSASRVSASRDCSETERPRAAARSDSSASPTTVSAVRADAVAVPERRASVSLAPRTRAAVSSVLASRTDAAAAEPQGVLHQLGRRPAPPRRAGRARPEQPLRPPVLGERCGPHARRRSPSSREERGNRAEEPEDRTSRAERHSGRREGQSQDEPRRGERYRAHGRWGVLPGPGRHPSGWPRYPWEHRRSPGGQVPPSPLRRAPGRRAWRRGPRGRPSASAIPPRDPRTWA